MHGPWALQSLLPAGVGSWLTSDHAQLHTEAAAGLTPGLTHYLQAQHHTTQKLSGTEVWKLLGAQGCS